MMSNNLLEVKDLSVNVEEQQILRGINLNIGKGETHVLMGPNGAGKSTLGYTIMGNPKYSVTGGEIIFNGKNIVDEEVNVRAKGRNILIIPESYRNTGNFTQQFYKKCIGAEKW